METRKIEKTNRTTGLVASVALAIALTVAVTFAWGFGNAGQAEASGSATVPSAVDVNGDHQVALGDLMVVLGCLGKTATGPCESSNVNGFPGIGLGDLMMVVKYYGQEVVHDDHVH